MTEFGSGQGEALAPQVVTQDNVGSTEEEALAEARAKTKAEAIANAQRGVASAQAKVARQQEHLVGAEQALANATAELAAVESRA